MTDDVEKPGPEVQDTGWIDQTNDPIINQTASWTIILDEQFDAEKAVEFAQLFGSPNICSISDRGHFSHVKTATVDDALSFIERLPKSNLYFCPARTQDPEFVGKPKKGDCLGSEWAWVDIDPPKNMTDADELQKWRELLLAELKNTDLPFPQLIVFSGRGLWFYWRLPHSKPAADVEGINYALAEALSADHCFDISHLARLPFTRNVKTGLIGSIWYRDDGVTPFDRLPFKKPRAADAPKIDLEEFGEAKLFNVEGYRTLIDTLKCPAHKRARLLQYVFEPKSINENRREPLDINDRSAVMFSWCMVALLAGMKPDDIKSCIISPELGLISAHLLDIKKCPPSQRERAAERTVRRACEKLAEDGSWPPKPYIPVSESECLEELNSKHAVLTQEGDKVRVLSFDQTEDGREIIILQSFRDFENRYLNRSVEIPKGEGKVLIMPLGKWWLRHSQRREYFGLRLMPGKPMEFEGYLNMWRGFAIDPRAGEWPLLQQHILTVLADGNHEHADYILNWCAWSVQNPDKPAETALVFRGGKGIGKGIFARAMRTLFGKHGFYISSAQHLTGRFNAHLRNCCFLFADEAIAPGDKNAESILKALITEPEITIEAKGINTVQARNRLHIVMASNEEWVVPAGRDERRFAVFNVSSSKQKDYQYFSALTEEINSGGLSAMLHDLLNRPLNNWHPRRNIPETTALQGQKDLSLSAAEQWMLGVLEDGVTPGLKVAGRDRTVLSNSQGSQLGLYDCMRRMSPRLREFSDQKLSSILRDWGCVNYTSGKSRGWTLPRLREARALWDKRMGPRTWSEQDEWAQEERHNGDHDFF